MFYILLDILKMKNELFFHKYSMNFLNKFKDYVLNELSNNIAQELSSWASENFEQLPFKSLFNDKTRMVIPFSEDNKNASSILKKLKEKGEVSFKTGTIFSAGRNIKFGKYVLNSGNFNEQEKSWWNKSGNPIKQLESQDNIDQYAIVISRNPIDIARMSDHDGWTSCHATNREYFQCALADAKGAGAIAYVVKKDDLRKINDLQDKEIFVDDDRHSKGIKPLARLRLRKFVHKKEQYDLAVPEARIYGSEIPGFKESLLKWSYENQQDKLKGERVSLKDFTLSGGSYQDSTGSSLLNSFFNDKLDKGDVEYDGEDDYHGTIAQMEEELELIQKEYDKKLEFVHPSYYISEDDEPYVYGTATIDIEIPENLINHKVIATDAILNKLRGSFNNYFTYAESIEFEDNKITLRIDSEGTTVDEYRSFCESLFSDIEEKKDEIIKYMYQEMYYLKLVNPTKSMKTFHDYSDNNPHVNFAHFEIEPNDDYSFHITISDQIPLPIRQATRPAKPGYDYKSIDNYYNYTVWINRFVVLFKQEMQDWHKRFVFMSKRQKTLFPIDDIKSFNVDIQPIIQFFGRTVSHRPIDDKNTPVLKIHFEIHILTEDEDYDDVVNYINFLDKNFKKFEALLFKINEQVTLEFEKSFTKK